LSLFTPVSLTGSLW